MAGAGAIRAGRAYVEINADDSGFLAGLKRAEDQLKAFGEQTSEMGRQMMTASAVVLAPSAMATRVFAGFDDVMREVQAKSQGTVEQLQMLTEKAKQLGATTSWKAEEVAGGMVQLAQAGFKPEEIDAAIEGVMDLARATHTDIPTAAQIAGNALRSFEMDAKDMGKVCDLLTTTANGSATNLVDLGYALKFAAASGHIAGESLADVLRNLGGLANLGVRGSTAGTSLRAIQTHVLKSGLKQAGPREEFQDLTGEDVMDEEGNLRSVSEMVSMVRDALAERGAGSGEIMKALDSIFGLRGMTGAGSLMNADLDSLTKALENAEGVARRTAETMDKGIGGSMRMFSSAVEAVAIKIGESLAPEIQKLSEYLIENTQKVGDWISQNKETIVTVAETAAKIGAAGLALVGLGKTIEGIGATVGGFKTVMGGIALAAEAIGGAPVAAAIIAAGAAAGVAAVAMHDFADAEDIAKQHAEAAAQDNAALARLEELAEKNQLNNQEQLEAAKIVDQLNRKYQDLGLTYDAMTGKIGGLAGAQEKMNAAQLRTAILDQRAILKEKQDELTQYNLKHGAGAAREYTLEEIQDFDRRGVNMQTEGYGAGMSTVSDEKRGSNISRAVYNPSTGKYQIAEQMAGVLGIGDETAEKAAARLEKEILARNALNEEIKQQRENIAALEQLTGSKDAGYAALAAAQGAPITPAAAPNVAAANEAAQTQNALQAETNELLKENNKLQRDIRDGVNKESDTI